ncbi:MAG: hypothetical protein ABL986_11910 [Vicinamibacterales bacterium]
MAAARETCWPGFGLATRAGQSDGVALLTMLVVLIATAAFVAALVLTSVVETRIAASWRDGAAAMSAADAVARRALLDLATADWDAALGGAVSTFTDGPPSGVRVLEGAMQLSLDAETSELACGNPTGCSDAEVSRASAERPWGANNPRWRLFGYGPLAALFPDDPYPLRGYVASWVADDPTETDGSPSHDGATADNPGRGVLLVTGRAYGPGVARRTVQLVVERVGTELRIIAWRELRP